MTASNSADGMWMKITLQYIGEEWAQGANNSLVSFDLLTILTCQGHISKPHVGPQLFKFKIHLLLKVIPLHAYLAVHVQCLQKAVILALRSTIRTLLWLAIGEPSTIWLTPLNPRIWLTLSSREIVYSISFVFFFLEPLNPWIWFMGVNPLSSREILYSISSVSGQSVSSHCLSRTLCLRRWLWYLTNNQYIFSMDLILTVYFFIEKAIGTPIIAYFRVIQVTVFLISLWQALKKKWQNPTIFV